MQGPSQPQTLVSIDVETTGAHPPAHSMISLGAAAYDFRPGPARGKHLARFTVNLRELPGATRSSGTMVWWQSEPAAWRIATRKPREPRKAMHRFCEWLTQFPRAQLLAGPVAYDGMWVRWYLETYCRAWADHLRWHNMLDLRTAVWSWTGLYRGDYRLLAQALTGEKIDNSHPHVAVCDAEEQGRVFFSLLRWAESRGKLAIGAAEGREKRHVAD